MEAKLYQMVRMVYFWLFLYERLYSSKKCLCDTVNAILSYKKRTFLYYPFGTSRLYPLTEALGDYVRVHTATQIYTIYFTMNKLAELLPEDRFSRIHRSVIVNLAQIQYMEGNFVRINQIDLPVGITFKERLVEKLTNK